MVRTIINIEIYYIKTKKANTNRIKYQKIFLFIILLFVVKKFCEITGIINSIKDSPIFLMKRIDYN